MCRPPLARLVLPHPTFAAGFAYISFAPDSCAGAGSLSLAAARAFAACNLSLMELSYTSISIGIRIKIRASPKPPLRNDLVYPYAYRVTGVVMVLDWLLFALLGLLIVPRIALMLFNGHRAVALVNLVHPQLEH
jgi:hypothetical protein